MRLVYCGALERDNNDNNNYDYIVHVGVLIIGHIYSCQGQCGCVGVVVVEIGPSTKQTLW